MKNFTEFNKQASQYASFRPRYPAALFSFLQNICKQSHVAFDVGTGSGQCAVDLARYFDKVYASDLSNEQIENALKNDKVSYFVAPAHESGLPSESVDLVTVATAIHWFDFDLFYSEVRRVLRKDGIIAVWAYGWHECENSKVTQIYEEIGKGLLLPFWSEQPKAIWSEYKTIPFPFGEMSSPKFEVTADWDLKEFLGYLSTWSASQKFADQFGHHPARDYFERLANVWGNPEMKLRFTSPLHLRVGEKECMNSKKRAPNLRLLKLLALSCSATGKMKRARSAGITKVYLIYSQQHWPRGQTLAGGHQGTTSQSLD